jgi:signal transduction histidine kinase
MDTPNKTDVKGRRYRILAGMTTWLVVSLAYLSPITPTTWGSAKWIGFSAALLYGFAVHMATRPRRAAGQDSLTTRYLLLLAAAFSLLVMILANPGDIVFILSIVIASILPEYFTLRRSALLQLSLHATLCAAYILRWEGGTDFLVESILWLAFEMFALLSSQIAADERRAREELEFSHNQLAATQHMLAATSRQDERLRISRDIHDVMGHHLTGLSLQLEVASHTDGEKSREHVHQAQLIAKLLLSDVRQVVNDLRDIDAQDLSEALNSLTANTGQLQVTLELPRPLTINHTRVAEAVFRSVQEIVTNAVRHSGGSRLNISLHNSNGQLTILAMDDGTISELPTQGNGLKGMRERIEHLGGTLKLEVKNGLQYEIHLENRQG